MAAPLGPPRASSTRSSQAEGSLLVRICYNCDVVDPPEVVWLAPLPVYLLRAWSPRMRGLLPPSGCLSLLVLPAPGGVARLGVGCYQCLLLVVALVEVFCRPAYVLEAVLVLTADACTSAVGATTCASSAVEELPANLSLRCSATWCSVHSLSHFLVCCSFSILSYGSSRYSPSHVLPDAHGPAVLMVGSLRWEAAWHEGDSFFCSSCLRLCTIAMSRRREGLVVWSVYSCAWGVSPTGCILYHWCACRQLLASLYGRSALLLPHCGSYIYGFFFEGPTADYEHRQSRRRAVLLTHCVRRATTGACAYLPMTTRITRPATRLAAVTRPQQLKARSVVCKCVQGKVTEDSDKRTAATGNEAGKATDGGKGRQRKH